MHKPNESKITADWLLARVRDNGEGCLVWTGYSQGGHPKANFGGDNKPVNVRREVWKAMTGKRLGTDRIIRSCCGTENCVDPAHLVNLPHGARNAGRKQTLTARAASAAALRAKSKIPQAAIPEIVNSDLAQDELAQKWGCTQTMISRIQLGKNRVELSTPFAGLGAR